MMKISSFYAACGSFGTHTLVMLWRGSTLLPGYGDVFVNNAQNAVVLALKDVGDPGILQMLFRRARAGGRNAGNLLGIQMNCVGGHGMVRAKQFHVNFTDLDSGSCDGAQIFTLPAQKHNTRALQPL